MVAVVAAKATAMAVLMMVIAVMMMAMLEVMMIMMMMSEMMMIMMLMALKIEMVKWQRRCFCERFLYEADPSRKSPL